MAGLPGKPRAFISNFCFGLLFGSLITYTGVKFTGTKLDSAMTRRRGSLIQENSVFQPNGHIVIDETNRVLESELQHFEQHHHHDFVGQDVIAKVLEDKVRILCWIMTGPQNIDSKAVHIYATWGKRCNKIIFISSEPSDKVPVVKVDTKEGRNHLWQKTRAAFTYIYENLLDEYDWFLKADDDTFIIVENLRYFLASYSTTNPIYFGHKFKPYVKQGYMSGGGGYVVSRAGVKQLVENAFSKPAKCHGQDYVGGAEDVEIGKCLENAGVAAGDSRDEKQRNRFHPFQPEAHLNPNGLPEKFWYWQYIFYPRNEGFEGCCADYSVSFHYIPPAALYNLEYLVYHLHAFGAGTYPCPAGLPPEILQEAKDRQQKVQAAAGLAPHEHEGGKPAEEPQGQGGGQVPPPQGGEEQQAPVVEGVAEKGEGNKEVGDAKPEDTANGNQADDGVHVKR